MASLFDSDEFEGFNIFNEGFMKRIEREMDEIEKAIKNGQLKGNWDVKRIDKPGMKGYIIQGYFHSDKPELLDPFEPIEPLRRRPMPKKPFEFPETALEETREPLTDVIEDKDAVKIYVELPGEEKDKIHWNFMEGKVEVKTKNFYKMIDLPTTNIEKEKTSSTYKNGILEILIPKKQKFEPKYYKL